MESIYILTPEWFDTIYLNYKNNEVIRNLNQDKGIFTKEKNKLLITWNQWGKETLFYFDNIYYNLDENDEIKIFLESDYFHDYAILTPKTQSIFLKNYEHQNGTYKFKEKKLIIQWNNQKEKDIYNSINYGRYFSSVSSVLNNKNQDLKDIKNIAIFFPQYHEFEENNQFWGKGFTEWTLLKQMPSYVNNQPIKQPYEEMGYYNLKNIEHRKYIEALANHYQIHGFCFYHYWFKNKKVMYEPLELMLKDNKPNVKFMFCWANEQWTKRWDGGNNEILIGQDYTDTQGNEEHFYYLLDFFKHKNYIKIENKPVFIFYRIEEKDTEYIQSIIYLWNKLAKNAGFQGIYFMRFLGPFNNTIHLDGLDAYVNFEPGNVCQQYYENIFSYDEDNIIFKNKDHYEEEAYLNKNQDIQKLVEKQIYSSGHDHYQKIKDCDEGKKRISKFFVFDGQKAYNKIIEQPKKYEEQHRGIFCGWNNSPRRNFTSDKFHSYPHYYKNIDVENFGDAYLSLLKKINDKPNKKIDFLFISAWNEWNEQAILEPNHIDGYNYLHKLSEKYNYFYEKKYHKTILNFSHKGGGTEKYMKDLKYLFPLYNIIDINIKDINMKDTNNIQELEKKYSSIPISFIHINSFYQSSLLTNYDSFFKNQFKTIRKIITIHDYQWLYPEDPNILTYLFSKDSINPENIKRLDYLFSICNYIIFPSYNILKNYNCVIDMGKYNNKLQVIFHNDLINYHQNLHIPMIQKKINIAYIGHFIHFKGSEIFQRIFKKYAYYQNYEIHYHVFGYLSYKEEKNKIKHNQFHYHHSYEENELISLLDENNIHGVSHLSLFEESYCYSLTHSINSGRPILFLNHGAFTERLKNQERYFSTTLNNIQEQFELFLDFIIKKQNIKKCDQINKQIQPKKWYLMNYK